MRLFLIFPLIFVGCSHGKLMRCEEDAPEEVWYCDHEIEDPYFKCVKKDQMKVCEEPR